MKNKPIFIEKINELKTKIELEGYEINGTKELIGEILVIDTTPLDLLKEENGIRDYYESVGIKTQVIRSLEHNLYEFIYRGLKQSIEQLFYFDKTQDYTSRRFVFSTTDCISHVHILYRHKKAQLNMYIRSTDVVKLLPWDILFACKLINRIIGECGFPEVTTKTVTIMIGSAHFYLKPAALY